MKNVAKKYLLQVQVADTAINQRVKELEDLKRSMYSVGAIGYEADKVQTSGNNDPYRIVDKYIDTEKRINECIDEFVTLKNKIISEIQGMNNKLYMELLYKRYIEYKSLWDIAKDMHYDYGYIRKCHGWALLAFERKYLQREK